MNSDGMALVIKGLNKHFGQTYANKNIDLSIPKGEIRGLTGENGSGKSTLLSQICGILKKDSGEIYLNGQIYQPHSPHDANKNKIAIVVQELGVINNLTIGENIFLGRTEQFSKFGIVNMKKLCSEANSHLKKWGMPELPLNSMADTLSVETKKLVELTRALSIDPDILLLDEITQALSYNNRNILYSILKKFKDLGRTVLLITHNIEELIEITDNITILRDGEVVSTEQSIKVTPDTIRSLMVGRNVTGDYYRADLEPSRGEEVVLEVKDVCVKNEIEDLSFNLHKGEILGFCGLSDGGMHTVGKLLFGLVKPDAGHVILKSKDLKIVDPETALNNGMAYIPKDRDMEALMIKASIMDNLCLPSVNELKGKLGYLKTARLRALSEETSKMFDVKSTGINQKMSDLSGGNKQKVNIGRWLAKDLDAIVMDCPTRGVDVGVKAFIYALMKESKQQGLSIILISDELTEVLGMADRLFVMKKGKIACEILRGADFTEETVIKEMI